MKSNTGKNPQSDTKHTNLEIVPMSADGISSELRVFCCRANSSNHPATLICLPAMGVAANKYDHLAAALAHKGSNVVIAELRGNGSSSVRASRDQDFGYHEIINIDLPEVRQQVLALFPQSDIYFLGHSLGGQMAALYLGQNPWAGKGLILCASCTVYFKNWSFPTNLGLLLFTQFGGLLARFVGHFPGRKIGFAGREAKSLMQDWAYNARTGRYPTRQQGVDLEAGLKSIDCPVLAINFADDTFAPVTGTRHLISKFSTLRAGDNDSAPDSNQAKYRHLTANDLGVNKADHFAWIKHPERVSITIANWLKELGK